MAEYENARAENNDHDIGMKYQVFYLLDFFFTERPNSQPQKKNSQPKEEQELTDCFHPFNHPEILISKLTK